ncbi:hypothetical protein TNCV_4394711 [Trichonephila clavipes]|uniref:Uncharacterized protein n=1 Tax=Trichonephila clavipes TaxID=2585209 RepID=A0A8X6W513_TRICX|nr:hypothetical protein TNCV_4394711 [Trichonephila clavipes]
MRGKHGNDRKLDQDLVKSAKVPRIPSHYCRSQSSIAELHRDYLKEVNPGRNRLLPVQSYFQPFFFHCLVYRNKILQNPRKGLVQTGKGAMFWCQLIPRVNYHG